MARCPTASRLALLLALAGALAPASPGLAAESLARLAPPTSITPGISGD
jgi:hypothetical protein